MQGLHELSNSVLTKIIDRAKQLERPIISDFGDYIPFLAYLGEETVCENHLKMLAQEIFNFTRPTQREDCLLGLIELYRWTQDKMALNLAEELVRHLLLRYYQNERIATPKDAYIRHVFEDDREKTLINALITRMTIFAHSFSGDYLYTPRNGIFIELLTDIYQLTGNKRYLQVAKNMANSWLHDPVFERYGLFPSFRLNPIGETRAVLTKDNTALIQSFVALYDITQEEFLKDAIYKWFRAVKKRCFDGSVWGKIYLRSETKRELSLLYSFSVIDALCDAYCFVSKDKEILSFAEEISAFWIKLQSEVGLVPMEFGSMISHQDYMTDFSISLWRLHELTGKQIYREVSEKAMGGLFKYHTFPLMVDFRNGTATSQLEVPKFIFLMLKPIILLRENAVYKKKEIFKLLRDR